MQITNTAEMVNKQAACGRPPRYAPAQACNWWHNI